MILRKEDHILGEPHLIYAVPPVCKKVLWLVVKIDFTSGLNLVVPCGDILPVTYDIESFA
ncbi:MAG: hypothetical protein HQ589_09425 [Syntrophaceae bacterium]|nr:hypothetical protein [Syntrophaceae bacterium]